MCLKEGVNCPRSYFKKNPLQNRSGLENRIFFYLLRRIRSILNFKQTKVMKNYFKFLFIAVFSALIVTSCSDDDDDNPGGQPGSNTDFIGAVYAMTTVSYTHLTLPTKA